MKAAIRPFNPQCPPSLLPPTTIRSPVSRRVSTTLLLMASLEDIALESREGGGDESGCAPGENTNSSQRVNKKRRRSARRRNTNDSDSLENGASNGRDPEVTINPEILEDDAFVTLPGLHPNVLRATDRAHLGFYDKFHHIADDHDRDFVKKYDGDLDTTLIFAGLFSAVASAFILDVQTELEPDYEEMNHALLKIIASSALGNVPTGADAAFPVWNGPDGTIVHVQAILYSSLSASLLAALLAMMGKQWLNRYASVELGSIIERGRRRKRKMDGMVTWKFDLVMECPPMMLQAALLLLGYALSNYLYVTNKVVASVVIGFTAFGLLFYLLIVSAATLSYNCPFQTPLSLIFRFLVRFDNEHKEYLKQSWEWFSRCLDWFRRIFTRKKNRPSLRSSGTPVSFDRNGRPGDRTELPAADPSQRSLWGLYKFDSGCIDWMLGKSMDADVTMAIARVVPEIMWHSDIRAVPLERFYDVLLECFDRSSRPPTVIPGFGEMAYLTAKALVHMVSQRLLLSSCELDTAVLGSISARHQNMGLRDCEGDSDLKSTLGVLDHVLCNWESPTIMDWQNFSFTVPHHIWMAETLFPHADAILEAHDFLPGDIRGFILHSLRLDPLPPASVVADCLFMVGLVLGFNPPDNGIYAIDQSGQVNLQIGRIYERLAQTFNSSIPAPGEISRALEAMELIAPLSKKEISQNSYYLFRVVMQAPISPSYTQENKWEASRLALRGAYKCDKFLPSVEDPQEILAFLEYHFEFAGRGGRDHHEPIQNALRALAHSPGPTIEALRRFDLARPPFVHDICRLFQNDKPPQLCEAALLFLPLIGDRWFDVPDPITGPGQMMSLCMDLASVVERLEHTHAVQRASLVVLLRMINSPHWRPHIVPENWRLLEYFTSVPDDDIPLRRCIDNPELIDAISALNNPDVLALWLVVLCWKYEELIPQVQKRLKAVMKETVPGDNGSYLDACLSMINRRLKAAGEALERSTGPAADALETEIDNLRQARVSLVALRVGED